MVMMPCGGAQDPVPTQSLRARSTGRLTLDKATLSSHSGLQTEPTVAVSFNWVQEIKEAVA